MQKLNEFQESHLPEQFDEIQVRGRYLMPSFLPYGLSKQDVKLEERSMVQIASKNTQILEDNMKDPYINCNSTLPGTASVLLKMMRETQNSFQNFQKPFLIIAGGMKQIIDPDVGHELIKQSTSNDKELIYYENMWHDCIAEQEILEIIPKIVEWIIKRQ